ncbi:hypothetical protein Q7P37_000132 [Cladosporium fusiforme]
MRLFLLPISTCRTLIFCERVPHTLAPGEKLPIADRIIDKSSETWTSWEKAEKGWKRKVTDYGNHLFRRIPFEEWGLKTIPAASEKRLQDIDAGKLKFECLFPGAFLKANRVEEVLSRIALDRQSLHRKKMWQSLSLMPATIPFTVVPVVPNLPFFYLCFRGWSHYKALYGGKLLEHLTSKKKITSTPSAQLDAMYTAGLLHPTRQASREASKPSEEDVERVTRVVEAQTHGDEEEVMLLQKWNGKLLAEAFHLPEMEVEIERAVEQVEKLIKSKKELEEEKKEVEAAGRKGEGKKEE